MSVWPTLDFDEEQHAYRVGGVPVRSVTQVIQAAGLADWRFVDEFYRERGSRAHKAVHYSLIRDLDLGACPDDLIGYVFAAHHFLEDMGATTRDVERRLCSPSLLTAGTLDWDGTLGQRAAAYPGVLADVLTIVDWKTSREHHPATAIQTAAYKEMLQEETGEIVRQRMSVLLADDGTYRYTVYRGDEHRHDADVFRAALLTTNWMVKHGQLRATR